MPGADDYMKLCWIAETLKLPQEDKDQIFIRMVFNYVAGISDDHNKNISFIMDKAGVWRLSPAYDVNVHGKYMGKFFSTHSFDGRDGQKVCLDYK